MESKTIMRRLTFSNRDAKPKVVEIVCSTSSVPLIMEWYGAFCAGDRYFVTLDGKDVPMDMNGCPVGYPVEE